MKTDSQIIKELEYTNRELGEANGMLEMIVRDAISLADTIERIASSSEFRSIFGVAAIHGVAYNGERWDDAIQQLRNRINDYIVEYESDYIEYCSDRGNEKD